MLKNSITLTQNSKIAAYICDNRFLVKPTKSAVELMPNAAYETPYDGAKEMLLVDNLDSKDFLAKLFNSIYDELPFPKKQNHRKKISPSY